jgi:uncharacterized protein YodC (DUF2158 family)
MSFRIYVGDLVQLKSGGQIMTVHHVSGERISCIWHDCEGRFQEASIDRQALKASPTDSQGPINLIGTSNQLTEQLSAPQHVTIAPG